ncbi:MAG: hypothetical protein ACJA0Q_001359 [Saprospiraceae bacterium]|jgi:hypothetical protein
MSPKEKEKIKSLIKKYNDVLLHSMSIAVAEDLINLIVVNGDDKGFELSELMKDQRAFKLFVISEFMKNNSKSVLSELKSMDDDFSSKMMKRKADKESQSRLDL